MCAISPKHQRHFKLSVFTSLTMEQEEFDILVAKMVVAMEIALNRDMRLRWHVNEDE